MHTARPVPMPRTEPAASAQLAPFEYLSCLCPAVAGLRANLVEIPLPTIQMIDPLHRLILCAHLSERFPRSAPCDKVALSPWQERRAKELMYSHMDRGLSIAQVAAECSLSRSHFSRAFKKNTGFSPRDWFLQVRLDKARTLLAEGRVSISRISLDCGFADQSHFTRVFTRVVGVTPFNWRRALATAQPA